MAEDVPVVSDSEGLAEFLLNASEGRRCVLQFKLGNPDKEGRTKMKLPSIVLPCRNGQCKGSDYVHDPLNELSLFSGSPYTGQAIIQYLCRNCAANKHLFAIVTRGEETSVASEEYDPFADEDITTVTHYLTKFGQMPPRGGPLPAAILNIADRQAKELLRKGLESERHSLGIGAFAYYRRALERMYPAMLAEIREIVPTEKQRKIIDLALRQKGLIRIFGTASRALPDPLRTGAGNPILLLNDCLNCGLHEGPSDSECLDIAHNLILSLLNVLVVVKEIKEFNRKTAEHNKLLAEFKATQKRAKALPQSQMAAPPAALPATPPSLPASSTQEEAAE